MSPIFNHPLELKKRFVALLWHLSALVGVALLNFVAANLGYVNLSTWEVTLVSLVVAQSTKYLSNYLSVNS